MPRTINAFNFVRFVKVARTRLWRQKVRRATKSKRSLRDQFGKAQVDNLDKAIQIQQQILWLQVSVDDLQMMTILNPGDELLEESTCLRLGHPPVRNDIVEQLSTGVFENNNDVGGCGYHLVPIT